MNFVKFSLETLVEGSRISAVAMLLSYPTSLIKQNTALFTTALTEALTRGVSPYCFGSAYTKIGTIQRRLAWPLRKDDTQIREAFQIFCFHFKFLFLNKSRTSRECRVAAVLWRVYTRVPTMVHQTHLRGHRC
eukprot:sb/3474851/